MHNWKITIAFIAALGSLTTMVIPALSTLLAVTGLIFLSLAPQSAPKGMRIAIIGMAVLALILDLVYLLVS